MQHCVRSFFCLSTHAKTLNRELLLLSLLSICKKRRHACKSDNSRLPFPGVNPSSMNLNTIEPPTGMNYKQWKQDLEIVLGVMDMDLALRSDEPPMPNEGCNLSQRSKHEKWEKSNRICLMIIKRSMTDVVREAFTDATNAKDFLKSNEQKYRESPKTETDTTNANYIIDSIEEKYHESPKIETGNLMMAQRVCVSTF